VAWNFQARFNVWGLRQRVAPTIVHFNGRPKPWSGRCQPWPEMYDVYMDRVAAVSDRDLHFEQKPDEEIAAANRDFEKKYGYLRNPIAVGLISLLVKIDPYERACLF
jgi:hypothetical protein